MKASKNSVPSAATLYIAASPIGNLGDISLRLKSTLETVALVAAEDTRVTQKLLNHLDLKKKVIRSDEFTANQSYHHIKDVLEQGEHVALLSDAGTPCISDPGNRIVHQAHLDGFRIRSIPGPSAQTAALSLSGFPAIPHLMLGFIPKKGKLKTWSMDQIVSGQQSCVIFENAKRIVKILDRLREHIPKRCIFLVRECTKLYEEQIRGELQDVFLEIKNRSLKGEVTGVFAPSDFHFD